MPLFADIILPTAVPGSFSYRVPEELSAQLQVGQRVVVNFGTGRKLYSGLVRAVHDRDPGLPGIKSVLSVLDDTPVATAEQLLFWERLAEHYLCTLGEVMVAALPGSLVLSSTTKLIASGPERPEWTGDGRRDLLLDALALRHEMTLAEAGELLGLRDPMPVVKRMLEEGTVQVAEEIGGTHAPRMERFVRLAAGQDTEAALHALFDRLERAPKQLHLLMRYVELSRCLSEAPREVKRKDLLRSARAASGELARALAKNIFEEYERPADMPAEGGEGGRIARLSEPQAATLERIRSGFQDRNTVLLHGVTSSGKTELYMELIETQLQAGKQVLYLLPEIALTAQVIARLRARFGSKVGVFHSRLPPRERTELWLRMRTDPDACPVIVGARSALLLPFRSLGLVVVDEEHDPSYKQHDPAPRYQARDMAIVLAEIHGARTLLGSATPSMESLYNARTGKFGFAELLVRHGEAVLPSVLCVDIADERRRKRVNGHFSHTLIDAIKEALARKEQVILFQNRRGYVPVWQCETCGWIPECDHCDVSLTYHKSAHGLHCHYCGRAYPPPVKCSACGSSRLRMIGFGTEKIEEELALLLPEARIARMDQDTTRGKNAFDRILSRFGEGAVDILVGTQMVTKGLDFGQVSLVGILDADQLLRYPDLRAHERAFQLMAQVAGRSGRRAGAGRVLIQTKEVHHPIIALVMGHDVEGMYQRELPLRQAHAYPPFSRLVKLTLKHRDEHRVVATAEALAALLRGRSGDRVLGPEPPMVARVRDLHLRTLLIKLERQGYRQEKHHLSEAIDRLFAHPDHRPVRVVIDVDPV
ncbi:MAG TPA: primosomal protein N' [Flavobacteriales bacterium]